MALARIITGFPEESHELVEDLRSRGFEVQIESPGKTYAQPADLEITVEQCDTEEALPRATGMKEACAFVMPGAITGGVRPIAAIPFIPPGKIEQNENQTRGVGAEIENLPQHSFGMNQSRADVAEFESTPKGDLESQPTIHEDAQTMISEPEHAAAEPLQPISLNQQAEDQQPEIISASASESVSPQTEPGVRAPQPELISAVSHAEESSVEAAQAISDAPIDELVLVEGSGVQEAQASELRREDLSTISPSLLADDLEVQTQAVELEAAAPALASDQAQVALPSPGSEFLSEEEIVQPPREGQPSLESKPVSDWPIWQPILTEEKASERTAPSEQPHPFYDVEPPTPSALALPPQSLPRSAAPRVRKAELSRHPIFTDDRVFWRTVALVGVIATGLVLGMSAHRLSPLPVSLQQSFSNVQPSATKPAMIPAALKPVIRPPRTSSPATRPARIPTELTPRSTTAAKVSLAFSKQPVTAAATESDGSEADIAQDTVVRYGSAIPAAAQSQKQPTIKPNSELN